MPRSLPVRVAFRDLETGNRGEGCGVTFRDSLPGGGEIVAFAKLHQAHGCRDIGHVVLIPGFQHMIKPRAISAVTLPGLTLDPMQAHDPYPFGDLVVAG